MVELNYEETVDEYDKPMYIVTSPKHKNKFLVSKSNDGFALFHIKVKNGPKPEFLEGKYTSLEAAYKRIKQYVHESKDSSAVRRDKVWNKNHAPTVRTDSSKQSG